MSLKLFFYIVVLIIAVLGYRSYANSKNALHMGDDAPNFRLEDIKGKDRTLEDYAGKYTVLYFYPKDETPGCIKEACLFRDDLAQLEKLGANVVGISVDTSASHAEFAKKYQLPFDLLSDTDGHVAARYQALNNFYILKLAKRHTFLISPDGKIAKIYRDVNVSKHSKQIIEDLIALQHTNVT
ncbi:MAG: peroxiredoxin [Methylotenera sp.]|nr:MAG: peroxiredoxin [Methylotenera sp.]